MKLYRLANKIIKTIRFAFVLKRLVCRHPVSSLLTRLEFDGIKFISFFCSGGINGVFKEQLITFFFVYKSIIFVQNINSYG